MAKAELLYVGTDSGILQFANPGGIGRWLRAGHSLPGSDIVTLWVDPADPTHLWCSDGTHFYRSNDGAQHWGDPLELGIDAVVSSRSAPQRLLALSDDHAILSHDAGTQWRRVAPATRIAMTGDNLWISTADNAHCSSDGGTTWQPDTPWLRRVASSDGATMLHIAGPWDALVWSLHGTSMAPLPQPLRRTPDALVVLAGAPPKILCLAGDTLWSYDSAWIAVAAAPPLTLLATTPYHPDRVWGADRAGALWYSSDRGTSWECIKTGLGTINTIVAARLI